MTTILISGAGGFVGSHILQQVLRRTDWDVVVVDSFRHNGGTDRILQAMTELDFPGQIGDSRGQIINDTRKRVTVMTHDLLAPFTAQHFAQLGGVDYMVHAAARCSVDDSIRDPYAHVMNNVTSTLTMLDAADRLGVLRYLHVSTDEVFGPFVGGSADLDRHSPSSPYAASKAASEDLTSAWRSTFGVNAAIVNSANLFGERQSQLAFIPKVISLVRAGKPVPIHTWGDEPAYRWYTYAPSLGAWVVDLFVGRWSRTRYPLRGQMGHDVKSLAGRIAAIMGQPIEYEMIPGARVRPSFDHSYAQMPPDATWSKPEYDAAEGLENTVRWFLERPDWLIDNG